MKCRRNKIKNKKASTKSILMYAIMIITKMKEGEKLRIVPKKIYRTILNLTKKKGHKKAWKLPIEIITVIRGKTAQTLINGKKKQQAENPKAILKQKNKKFKKLSLSNLNGK